MALWYATRATGLVALVLLSATTLFGLRVAGRGSTGTTGYVRAELHRRLSLLTVAFLGVHVLTSVMDTFVRVGWSSIVLPFVSPYKAVWVGLGAVSVDAFVAVLLTSVLRHLLPAPSWRAVHWLAYLSWPVAVAHSIGMGTDMKLRWVLAVVATCVASVAGTATWRLATALRALASHPATARPVRASLRRLERVGSTR